MAARELFTDSEWQALLFAPLWAMSAVALADGKFDAREEAAVKQLVFERSAAQGELADEVLGALGPAWSVVLGRFRQDTRSPVAGLAEAAAILAKAPAAEALGYRRTVYELGRRVAEASARRGQASTSPEEERALAAIGQTLGLAPAAAFQPPPGWYDDPHGQARLRYWDGSAWTEHTYA